MIASVVAVSDYEMSRVVVFRRLVIFRRLVAFRRLPRRRLRRRRLPRRRCSLAHRPRHTPTTNLPIYQYVPHSSVSFDDRRC